MKGLLYREFYITKKHCFMISGMTILFTFFSALVLLSLKYGNLRNADLDGADLRTMFIVAIGGISFMLADAVNQSVYSDCSCKWMTNSYCLPLSSWRAVGIRYLYGLLLIAGSTLYTVLYAGILRLITGTPLNPELVRNGYLIPAIGMCYITIMLPMALYYQEARAVEKRAVVAGILIYVIAAGSCIMKTKDMNPQETERFLLQIVEQYKHIRDILLPFLPIILIIMLAVSFYLSAKIYQRRGK